MELSPLVKKHFIEHFGANPVLWKRFVEHCATRAAGVYRSKPLTPKEFFTSEYHSGEMAGKLYPVVFDALCESSSGRYVEAVLTGGIGCSKTTIALHGTKYQLYLLSLMANPHQHFGLLPSDEILIVFQSLNASLSKNVDFGRFMRDIEGIQYFKDHFPFDPEIRSELRFPSNVIVRPLSGKQTAAIGSNVIGGVLDEVNFMSVIESSKESVDGGTYDQAQENYNSIRRRRESRFMSMGEVAGMLYLVSSKRYPGEFTDRKIQEAQKQLREDGKTSIFVYDKSIWQVQPHKFGTKRFPVFVGDQTRQPRIVDEEEAKAFRKEDERLILDVPVEYRASFEADVLDALRDIGGRSTMALHPFIIEIEKAMACFGTVESVLSRDKCDFRDTQVDLYPKRFRNPKEPRFVHIDLGYKGDSAGVACGYVPQFIEMHRGQKEGEWQPVIEFDFVLEVSPPKNGEVIFAKIRTLIYLLRKLGLNIQWVTLDSFQSRDTIQILRQQGFTTGLQSIDRTTAPYSVLKSAFLDGRVRVQDHAKAKLELSRLEEDEAKGKIDHPPNGSKDCVDAMAGVAYGLATRRLIWARKKVLKHMPTAERGSNELNEQERLAS